MVSEDMTVRRLAPGVFAIGVGVMLAWSAWRALDLGAGQRSALFTASVVVSVLSALLLDVSLDPVASRFALPRTVVVPLFVAATMLAAAGPSLFYAVHRGLLALAEAGVFWMVLFATLVTYVVVGIGVGRLARRR